MRQGGISSPFLFNCVYKDMIDQLSSLEGGVTIGGQRFNVYCYADDVLLASTTVTGLQNLINHANNYVTNHGLSFNASKTVCYIHGKNPFTVQPEWIINGEKLQITENINYLGAILGNKNGTSHCEKRISSCRKSFFALQGAGLCDDGLKVDTSVHVWSAACQSVLAYGCESLYLSKQNRTNLNKLQANHIKCIIGIGNYYRTSPLLQALNMNTMSDMIDFHTVALFKSIMSADSAAKTFNQIMMKQKPSCKKLLFNRAKEICSAKSVNVLQVILNSDSFYKLKTKILYKVKPSENGVIDSLRSLLYGNYRDQKPLIKLLLKAF